MRRRIPGTLLAIALLMPGAGEAQVLSRPMPSPSVNAASAEWLGRGEPIFHAGNYYFPTGPNVFFDGNVMVPAGFYDGVPIYVDTTVEPYSLILVPIGSNLLRPYERRRAGDLAGTAGSRTPSFPVEASGDLRRWQQDAPAVSRVRLPVARVVTEMEPADTAVIAPPTPEAPAEGARGVERPDAVRASQSIVNEVTISAEQGIWIEFEGSRWFSSGPSVPADAGRFVPVGSYRGFEVYRDGRVGADTIFVRIVLDGPLAPYSRR
jgi:hypothetical protein